MERLIITRDGERLFSTVDEATGFLERLRGLSGRDAVAERYAMAFRRCPRIHCRGMRVPIDVVTCDEAGNVLDARTVAPGRLGPRLDGAYWAIECREGAAGRLGLGPGQRLNIERRP